MIVALDVRTVQHGLQLTLQQQVGLGGQEGPQADYHVVEDAEQDHLVLKAGPELRQACEMRLAEADEGEQALLL